MGQLTNEIKNGREMQVFISLGARDSTYRSRGINLNYRARQVVNFNRFYNLVTHNSLQIFRKNYILSKPVYKIIYRGQWRTHQEVNK